MLHSQPALYFWVFLDAFPALEPVQRVLGCLVAGREALYLLSVLACTVVNPAFLLVDVGASVRDITVDDVHLDVDGGYSFLFMYVVAPEKFVAAALFGEGGLDIEDLYMAALFGGALLDLCGLAALGAGLSAGSLPAALAVGYSVTALGALWLAGGLMTAATTGERWTGVGIAVGAVIAFLVPLALCLPTA